MKLAKDMQRGCQKTSTLFTKVENQIFPQSFTWRNYVWALPHGDCSLLHLELLPLHSAACFPSKCVHDGVFPLQETPTST